VINRGADHAGHRRHRFEHDGAMAIAFGEEGIGAKTQELGEPQGKVIGKATGLMVDGQVDERFVGHVKLLNNMNICIETDEPPRIDIADTRRARSSIHGSHFLTPELILINYFATDF